MSGEEWSARVSPHLGGVIKGNKGKDWRTGSLEEKRMVHYSVPPSWWSCKGRGGNKGEEEV